MKLEQEHLPQISKPMPSQRTSESIAQECLLELKTKTKPEEKQELLQAAWIELCENDHDTFYIEHPLSVEAKQLREIAKELIENKNFIFPGKDNPNGCAYRLLMPTVVNVQGKNLDLPTDTSLLIITDPPPGRKTPRNLLLISEIESFIGDKKRDVLLNPKTGKPLSFDEFDQLRRKNLSLYQEYIKTLDQETMLIFSDDDEGDQDLLSPTKTLTDLIQQSNSVEFLKFLDIEIFTWNFANDPLNAITALNKFFSHESDETSFYQSYPPDDALKLFRLSKGLYTELRDESEKKLLFKIILSALPEHKLIDDELTKACLGYQVFLKEFENDLDETSKGNLAEKLSSFIEKNSNAFKSSQLKILQRQLEPFKTQLDKAKNKNNSNKKLSFVQKLYTYPFEFLFRPTKFAERLFGNSDVAKWTMRALQLTGWILFAIFFQAEMGISITSESVLDLPLSEIIFSTLTALVTLLVQWIDAHFSRPTAAPLPTSVRTHASAPSMCLSEALEIALKDQYQYSSLARDHSEGVVVHAVSPVAPQQGFPRSPASIVSAGSSGSFFSQKGQSPTPGQEKSAVAGVASVRPDDVVDVPLPSAAAGVVSVEPDDNRLP